MAIRVGVVVGACAASGCAVDTTENDAGGDVQTDAGAFDLNVPVLDDIGLRPDVVLPDAAAPDGPPPDGSVADVRAPDGPLPDAVAPDGPVPDAVAPDGPLPDAVAPDGPSPDAAAPDGPLPDAAEPDGPGDHDVGCGEPDPPPPPPPPGGENLPPVVIVENLVLPCLHEGGALASPHVCDSFDPEGEELQILWEPWAFAGCSWLLNSEFPIGVTELAVTATDPQGAETRREFTVTVLDGPPEPRITATPALSADAACGVDLRLVGSDSRHACGEVTEWRWTVDGAPAGEGAVVGARVEGVGSHTVELTACGDTGGCVTTRAEVHVPRSGLDCARVEAASVRRALDTVLRVAGEIRAGGCDEPDPDAHGALLRVDRTVFNVPPGGFEPDGEGWLRYTPRVQRRGDASHAGAPVTTASLPAGVVFINDIPVPAAVPDCVSTSLAGSSAIAVATAINSVADETQVRARAGAAVVTGGRVNGGTLDASNFVIINDESVVNLVANTDDAGGALVDAVNAKEGETGVRARMRRNRGLDLVARDGRNIETIVYGRGAEAITGLSSWRRVYSGHVVLESDASFELDGELELLGIDGSHLRVDAGQWSGDFAHVRPAEPAVAWVEGEVRVRDVPIRPTNAVNDPVSSHARAGSAIAKAAALNASSRFTGLRARVNPTRVEGAGPVGQGETEADTLWINDVAIPPGGLPGVLNEVTDQTGVVAALDDDGVLLLVAGDGRNVHVRTDEALSGLEDGISTASITMYGDREEHRPEITAPGAGAIHHGQPVTTDALEAGALLVNDLPVPAAAPQAIAKADAINSLFEQTGVHARAGVTRVAAGVDVRGGVLDEGAGALRINDVVLPMTVVQPDDADGALRGAINALTPETGVHASLDRAHDLVLTAPDGRDVVIETTPSSSATSGLGAPGRTVSAAPIILESDGPIELAGVGADAGLSTPQRIGVSEWDGLVAHTTAPATNLSLGDAALEINNVIIRASTGWVDDSVSTAFVGASAIAKAAAINDSTTYTRVTARANPAWIRGAAPIAGGEIEADQLVVNAVSLGAVSVQPADADGALRDAFGATAGFTGVTATVDAAGRLVLRSSDGRNIALEPGADGITGLANGVYGGSITLMSSRPIEVRHRRPIFEFAPRRSYYSGPSPAPDGGWSLRLHPATGAFVLDVDSVPPGVVPDDGLDLDLSYGAQRGRLHVPLERDGEGWAAPAPGPACE